MASVIYRVRDRCESICMKSRRDCSTNQKQQAGCVSDRMTYGTSSLVRTKNTPLMTGDRTAGDRGEPRTDECEMSNWIKYLQVMHLISLSALVLDTRAVSNWTEIRYPPPSEFEGQIKIVTDDGIRARLLNFSPGGMQALSPWPIDRGEQFGFRVTADMQEGAGSRFRAECTYCVPVKGSFLCGARVHETGGRGALGFLGRVHEIMLDYNRRVIASA